MKRNAFFAAMLLFVIPAPAWADEPLAVTPSGSTEAFFDLPLIETSDVLANSCVDFGWKAVSSSESVVICEVPVSTGNKLLAALAGPAYATPPREYIRFNLSGYRGFARVQASGWREQQTAFGQTQRLDLENENYHNTVMGMMVYLGALYPPGTEFPNHAMMGVDYEFVDAPEKGMLIKDVDADGPFALAGFQRGDIVMRIARERIKDNNDVSDGLHKAIKNDTFEVQFTRGGKKMEAAVARVFRPRAGPLPEPTVAISASEQPNTTIIQSEFSIAEELAKLADLRDRGILTEEEFEQQKAKLLAR